MEHIIPGGTVHRTIGLLQHSLAQLGANIIPREVERIGVIIHRAMSMQQRSFHTPEHIFDLSDPSDAHGTLAALFHDTVYYQVDEGFLAEIEDILSPYIINEAGTIRIRDTIPAESRAFYGTAAVFGFVPGDAPSPFGGLNEFLSALVMNHLLEGIVRDADLLIATASIEMTIPFRGPDESGQSPAERLDRRIRSSNEEFGLGLAEEALHRTVTAAVGFSNHDVQNFAEEDPGRFLDNTWKLLPETNPALRFQGLYTVKNYSAALMKMEGFLGGLNPEHVFQRYNEFPPPAEYERLLARVSRNLETARIYLGIKMVSAGILLALAELTGGDAPVSFFMGDIDPDDPDSTLTAYLPDHPPCFDHETRGDATLYRLLEQGRASSSHFDLQNSPLSLFVYRCLTSEEMVRGIEASRSYIREEIDTRAFLGSVPPQLVEAIARAAAVLAFTRKEELLNIAEEYC